MRPKYIMNEKKYIENIILNKKYEVDKDFSKDLFTLIKYYCQQNDYNKDKTIKDVNNFIDKKSNKQNKLDKNEWQDFIAKIIDICIKFEKKLRELDKIHITKDDYKYIDTLETKELKKTLFTMIILVKLINNENPQDAKITYTFNEIFKLANLSSLKRNVRQDIIRELKDRGLIDTEVIKDVKTKDRKIVYKVLCVSNDTNDIYFITDIHSLGKKYCEMKRMLGNRKLKQCERCGCLIEINEKNNNKYCYECSKIMKQIQINECKSRKKNKS